jgi:transcriptional regulator with XRE-family HTH domain
MSIGRMRKFRSGLDRFSECIRLKRKDTKFSLREAAQRIGISHSTLLRMEKGKMMDVRSFVLVVLYYRMNIELWASVVASSEKP